MSTPTERLAQMADAEVGRLERRVKKQAHALAAAISASPKRLAEMREAIEVTEAEARDWRAIALIVRASAAPVGAPEPGWRPIGTHDEGGQNVLLWDATYPPGEVVVGFRAEHDSFETARGRRIVQPTHWMPLPTAPGGVGAPEERKP